jgi:hypothetical protein
MRNVIPADTGCIESPTYSFRQKKKKEESIRRFGHLGYLTICSCELIPSRSFGRVLDSGFGRSDGLSVDSDRPQRNSLLITDCLLAFPNDLNLSPSGRLHRKRFDAHTRLPLSGSRGKRGCVLTNNPLDVLHSLDKLPQLRKALPWLIGTVTLQFLPTVFRQLLDLIPHTAHTIRQVPIELRLTAINGEIAILKAQQRLNQQRSQSVLLSQSQQHGELPIRASTTMLAMPDKTG